MLLAVELDGSSHGRNPLCFGEERTQAMWQQEELDRDKDAELLQRRYQSVRIGSDLSLDEKARAMLKAGMDLVAYGI